MSYSGSGGRWGSSPGLAALGAGEAAAGLGGAAAALPVAAALPAADGSAAVPDGELAEADAAGLAPAFLGLGASCASAKGATTRMKIARPTAMPLFERGRFGVLGGDEDRHNA